MVVSTELFKQRRLPTSTAYITSCDLLGTLLVSVGSAMLPLEDVRVIDLTLEVAGPFCSMLLADMGADTIKVERPSTGENIRALGPYGDVGLGVYFMQFNRNKRSLALDLKKQEAKEVFMKLVKTADVLVDYSPVL